MADKKDWLERLKDERWELCRKLNNLEAFLDRLKSGEAKIEDQPQHYTLLLMQREVMRQYVLILDRRLELADPPEYFKTDVEDLRRHG